MSVPELLQHVDVAENQLIKTSTQSYLKTKRALDLALVLITAPITLPILAISAIIVKLESKGPLIFTQQRVGLNGEIFTMYKLRSMQTDSESSGSQFAQASDARVTRFGKITRKFRIDELPQLWNIIKGEMSFIGPRPEQAKFVSQFNQTIAGYSKRHVVRPGITGLAQTEQGYVDDADGTVTKLKYDLYYIKNLSFGLDFQITLKTLFTIATGFGAR